MFGYVPTLFHLDQEQVTHNRARWINVKLL